MKKPASGLAFAVPIRIVWAARRCGEHQDSRCGGSETRDAGRLLSGSCLGLR